jgi:hypothetical protein
VTGPSDAEGDRWLRAKARGERPEAAAEQEQQLTSALHGEQQPPPQAPAAMPPMGARGTGASLDAEDELRAHLQGAYGRDGGWRPLS